MSIDKRRRLEPSGIPCYCGHNSDDHTANGVCLVDSCVHCLATGFQEKYTTKCYNCGEYIALAQPENVYRHDDSEGTISYAHVVCPKDAATVQEWQPATEKQREWATKQVNLALNRGNQYREEYDGELRWFILKHSDLYHIVYSVFTGKVAVQAGEKRHILKFQPKDGGVKKVKIPVPKWKFDEGDVSTWGQWPVTMPVKDEFTHDAPTKGDTVLTEEGVNILANLLSKLGVIEPDGTLSNGLSEDEESVLRLLI